jgi:hypothetical protein
LTFRTNVVDHTPNRVEPFISFLGTERRRVNLLLEKKSLLTKTGQHFNAFARLSQRTLPA